MGHFAHIDDARWSIGSGTAWMAPAAERMETGGGLAAADGAAAALDPRERLKAPQIAPLLGLEVRHTFQLFKEGKLPNRGKPRDVWCYRSDVEVELERRRALLARAKRPPAAGAGAGRLPRSGAGVGLPLADWPPGVPLARSEPARTVGGGSNGEGAEGGESPIWSATSAADLARFLLPDAGPEEHQHVADLLLDIWCRLDRMRGPVAVLKLEEFLSLLKRAERHLSRIGPGVLPRSTASGTSGAA